MTAKARWEELQSRRTGPLQRARDAAALTIPSLLPPEGADDNTELPQPYQSLGARGVNNLASKLLLTLFPAGSSFVRLRVDDSVKNALEEEQQVDVDAALVSLENRIIRGLEIGPVRSKLHAAIKHLIVCGNGLMFLGKGTDTRLYRLDQYCIVRSPSGRVVEGVVKEKVNPKTLNDATRAACQVHPKDEDVDVYTWIRLEENRHVWHQEINDQTVPDSKGRAKEPESPWLALRWQGGIHEDYGRGLVEEYMGDLRTLEGATKSIIGFAAVAAKVLFLLNPSSSMTEQELEEADIGDVLSGKEGDISVLTLEKFNDFQVAKAVVDEVSLRLSYAFLLQSGTVRDAERVTAQEIREMAQELEDVLGGTYTVLSQELQLPLVRRRMAVLREQGEFPAFPTVSGRDAIEPTIITGFDALGRGHELNRLRAWAQDAAALVGEQVVQQMLNSNRTMTHLATFHNVDLGDILNSEDELQQRQQQQRGREIADKIVDKATGPVAQAAADQYTNGGE